jgi:hypothetical protein
VAAWIVVVAVTSTFASRRAFAHAARATGFVPDLGRHGQAGRVEKVGVKSRFSAIALACVPALMPAGHRTRNGVRSESA